MARSSLPLVLLLSALSGAGCAHQAQMNRGQFEQLMRVNANRPGPDSLVRVDADRFIGNLPAEQPVTLRTSEGRSATLTLGELVSREREVDGDLVVLDELGQTSVLPIASIVEGDLAIERGRGTRNF